MNIKHAVYFLVLLGCLAAAMPLMAQSSPMHFTKIQVQHYDAGVMAGLITQPDGIIVVPPNFVISAAKQSAASAVTTVKPVLPQGIQRIYVLESDNSVVIQTAP